MGDAFRFSFETREVFAELVSWFRDKQAERFGIDPVVCTVLRDKLLQGSGLTRMEELIIRSAYDELVQEVDRLEKP